MNYSEPFNERMRRRVGGLLNPILDRLKFVKTLEAPRDEMVRQLFMAIIAMCRKRIVQRGRLGATELKPRFPVFLEKVSEGLSQLRGVDNKRPCKKTISKLISQMHLYSEMTKELGCEVPRLDGDLADIIDECENLRNIDNWESILLKHLDLAVPKMNLNEREALLNMTRKMSQYKHSAERLVAMYRSQWIVRRASTVLVRLDDAAFERSSARPAQVRQVLARIEASHNTSLDINRLAQKLQNKRATAYSKSQTTLKNVLESSRIHAEMQLIWYLDLNPSRTPPRVLASNKDACYLCNAFISLHGMYTIPRSHGRVYAGWRLPATELADNVHKRFIQELERMVVSRAREVLNGTGALNCPLESTCNSSIGSLTTMLTVDEALSADAASADGAGDAGGSDSEATLRPGDDAASSVGAASEDSPGTPVAENSGAADSGIGAPEFAGDAVRADVADHYRDSSPIPHRASSSTHNYENGGCGGSWRIAEVNRVVELRLSDRLRVYVEYSTAVATATPRGRLRFRVHQVSPEEARAVVANGEVVYDVHHELPPLQDIACQTNSRFVNLRAGSDVFRIELG